MENFKFNNCNLFIHIIIFNSKYFPKQNVFEKIFIWTQGLNYKICIVTIKGIYMQPHSSCRTFTSTIHQNVNLYNMKSMLNSRQEVFKRFEQSHQYTQEIPFQELTRIILTIHYMYISLIDLLTCYSFKNKWSILPAFVIQSLWCPTLAYKQN